MRSKCRKLDRRPAAAALRAFRLAIFRGDDALVAGFACIANVFVDGHRFPHVPIISDFTDQPSGKRIFGYTGGMARIYAGTSGWSYASWKPVFYPAKLASAKFLSYYATRLNSVEVNYTFRRFPTERLLEGWIAATPAEFKFALKAHQMITHIKRLRETADWLTRFFSSLRPLEDTGKLGPILFQLPPNLKCDASLLMNFLEELPPGIQPAFEFRDASWFCEEVYAALRAKKAALCQAESEKIETPAVQTAGFGYLRLRKESYSPKELAQIGSRVREMSAAGDEVFVYFKHEETPEGALCAERLLSTSPR